MRRETPRFGSKTGRKNPGQGKVNTLVNRGEGTLPAMRTDAPTSALQFDGRLRPLRVRSAGRRRDPDQAARSWWLSTPSSPRSGQSEAAGVRCASPEGRSGWARTGSIPGSPSTPAPCPTECCSRRVGLDGRRSVHPAPPSTGETPSPWWPQGSVVARTSPRSVAEHPAVLLTLTAPSFGPVHRQAIRRHLSSDRSHLPPRADTHAAEAGTSRPTSSSARRSVPDCYDYEGAVLFNAGVSELWRRTTIYALRALGALLGMSAREAARNLRLSYVKVVEFQRRGSVHLHALVRADTRGDELGESPLGIDADMISTALHIAARKVTAPLPGSDGERRMAWGEQVDVAPVTEAENGRRRAAAYLAKYATKGSDEHGVLDHRLRSGTPRDGRLPDHLRNLVATAWELGDQPGTETSAAAVGPHLWVPGPLPHQVAPLLDDLRRAAGRAAALADRQSARWSARRGPRPRRAGDPGVDLRGLRLPDRR